MAKSRTTPDKPRLGRGLSSLMANSSAATRAGPATPAGHYVPTDKLHVQTGQTSQVAIDQIGPNPYQARQDFDQEKIAELAQSIRQQGILQPLLLAPATDSPAKAPYVLIAGQRRLRAARDAGLQTVPCIVRSASKQQIVEWGIIENIQRDDLNPVELAHAYHDYIERFSLTQAQVAERVGAPRATVANYLRILDLCDEIQRMLLADKLSFGHAKVLGALSDHPRRQLALARRAAKKGLSVRQLEGLITADASRRQEPSKAPPKAGGRGAYIRDLEAQLTRHVGTRVTIAPGKARDTGRVIIEYYNLDDFDRIVAGLGAQLES